jgi:hypothetical protein
LARFAADVVASEPGVHRFGLERKNAEDTFVNAAERLPANETLERFDTEREFRKREGPLSSQAA